MTHWKPILQRASPQYHTIDVKPHSGECTPPPRSWFRFASKFFIAVALFHCVISGLTFKRTHQDEGFPSSVASFKIVSSGVRQPNIGLHASTRYVPMRNSRGTRNSKGLTVAPTIKHTIRHTSIAATKHNLEGSQVVPNHKKETELHMDASQDHDVDEPTSIDPEIVLPDDEVPLRPSTSTFWDRLPSLWASGALLGLTLPGMSSSFDLIGIESTIQAVVLFATIICVHEAGHFLVARVQGIHVSSFNVGFGPNLLEFKRGEIDYRFNALPFGGYVTFPDADDPKGCDYEKDDPNLLNNRPALSRIPVIVAGVLFNVLFCWAILFSQVNILGTYETIAREGVKVYTVQANTAAQAGGLRKNDLLMQINGEEIGKGSPGRIDWIVNRIRANPGRFMKFDIIRDGAPTIVEILPDDRDGIGYAGMSFQVNEESTYKGKPELGEAVALANKGTAGMLQTVAVGVTQMSGFSLNDFSGPVAMLATGSEIAKDVDTGKEGAGNLFQFAAVINANLAVVNLIPLPGLDGFALLLAFIELLSGGKKLPKRVVDGVYGFGALFLLSTGALILLSDLDKLLK